MRNALLVIALCIGAAALAAAAFADDDLALATGYRLLEDVTILERLQEAQVADAQIAQLLPVVKDYLAGRAGEANPSPLDDPLTRDLLARARQALLSGPLPADLDLQVQQVVQALLSDRQRTRQVLEYATEQVSLILSEDQVAKLAEPQLGRAGWAGAVPQPAGPQDPQVRIADVLIDEFQKLKEVPDTEWQASLDKRLKQAVGNRLQADTQAYEQLKVRLMHVAVQVRRMTNAEIEANREPLRADVIAALRPDAGAAGPLPTGPLPRYTPRQAQDPQAARVAARQPDPARRALLFLADYRTVRVLEAKVGQQQGG